ncbi:hypothetical protein Tco_0708961 [Tanacetum coccineum]
MHRTTPSAHRSPTLTIASPQGKKRKQIAGEISLPRKPHKVTIKQKAKTTSIPPTSDDKERDEIAEATFLSLALHKIALADEAQENVAKVPEQLEEKIHKMVEGDEDEESYASEFADSMFNDDNDDTPDDDKNVDDEDKDVDVEKKDDGAEDKDNDDQTDQALVGTHASGSFETRNQQMQTLIPTPNRSPRKYLSLDKTIYKELTVLVSPTTATTSKVKSKQGFSSNKKKILPRIIAGMSRRCGQIRNHIKNKFVTHEHWSKLMQSRSLETRNQQMQTLIPTPNRSPRKDFSTHAPKIIEELFQKHMQNTTLNLYPKTSSSTAAISTVDLQHQLYLTMKSKPQDQVADLELWEILKTKFEKP